jgi:ATP-binding protein involved in chromosome partitioning
MSYHVCTGCGERVDLFGSGGGSRVAQEFAVPLLGEIPLVQEIREAADAGTPIVARQPDHPQSQVFRAIARRLISELDVRPIHSVPSIH